MKPSWKVTVGKIVPWAVGATGGLFAALGLEVKWWGVASGLIVGIAQFVISIVPD